jgi:hypothetical protein
VGVYAAILCVPHLQPGCNKFHKQHGCTNAGGGPYYFKGQLFAAVLALLEVGGLEGFLSFFRQ